MVRFVSVNTQARLPKDPHLILQDWLYTNWLTAADNTNYPGLPLRDEIAFGYHWSERQRANKIVTLRTRPEPEIPRHYINPHLHDYHQRVWVDYYMRVLDTTFDGTIPQLPSSKLSVVRDFIRDKIETTPNGLAASGVHEMIYDRFDEIPNPDEDNVFHAIVYIKLIYRLVGI